MKKILSLLCILLIGCTAEIECETDSDCVPSSCCHSTECTARANAPECDLLACTDECAPNTLDCGQGSCICQNNKCATSFK